VGQHFGGEAAHRLERLPHPQRLGVDQQAVHPGVGVRLGPVEALPVVVPIRGDLQFGGVAALAVALGPQGVHQLAEVVEVLVDHVPAVAAGHDPADGGRRRAPDDDRDARLLHRGGQHLPAVPVDEAAPEVDGLPGPRRGHGVDVLIRPSTAVVERHAEGVELLLEPADPEAEHQPAAGQVVDRRRLLGQVQRVHLGQDVDAGAEPEPLGAGRHPGEGDERVDEAIAARHGQLPARVVGVAGGVLAGHDHVLEGPHRLEAELLRQLGEAAQLAGAQVVAGVDRHHADVHAFPLCVVAVAGGPGSVATSPRP
jgi:hypothetical protein